MKLKLSLAIILTVVSYSIFAKSLQNIDCFSGTQLILRQDAVYIDFLPNNVIAIYQDEAHSNLLQIITNATCKISPTK